MRRIVLPLTEVGMGGETIAKILFCRELAEPEMDPSPGMRNHWECLAISEREITRRLEPWLNRGVPIPPLYHLGSTHSYRLSVRFSGSTSGVICTPSFGRAITREFRPVGWRSQTDRLVATKPTTQNELRGQPRPHSPPQTQLRLKRSCPPAAGP